MRQITVTLNVYEDIILEESGCETLGDAISQELGWLRDSGMVVQNWNLVDSETQSLADKYAELRENFIDYVCSGTSNAAPYCANRCSKCIDARGWCISNNGYCRGFRPK